MNENHLHFELPRGTGLKPHGTLPEARFEDPEAIRKTDSLIYREGMMFLGLIDATISAGRDAKTLRKTRHATGGHAVGFDDDRHLMTVAGSRAGKAVAAIIPNLLSYPGSALVIDPKAELSTVTARHRADYHKQAIHVLDPFQKAKGRAATLRAAFNPLDILKRESPTIVEDAGLIADALIVPSSDGEGRHWDETAQNFVEGVVLHVATASKYQGPERNLITVYRLIMNLQHNGLDEEMRSNAACEDAVIDAANNFFEKQERERYSVLSTIRRQLRFLGYKNMQSVLSHSTFDLADLKRKKTTIYLSLPAMRMGTCFRWFRLFVNMALAKMEEDPTKPERPVLFCLDEFPILGHLKTIEDAAGQIAGFGVRLWPIIQDISQLKALYKDRWETFMGNAGTIQCFGNNDSSTLEWISQRLGPTTIKTASEGGTTYKARAETDATGVTLSSQAHPLLTGEEASRFFGREDRLQRQLIIRATFHPLILQRVCYYEDARFKGQFDPLPSDPIWNQRQPD